MEHVAGIDPVCEDLCAGILDELPSRALVQLRGTSCAFHPCVLLMFSLGKSYRRGALRSRLFAELVNEILRRRFLSIVGRGANELVVSAARLHRANLNSPSFLTDQLV